MGTFSAKKMGTGLAAQRHTFMYVGTKSEPPPPPPPGRCISLICPHLRLEPVRVRKTRIKWQRAVAKESDSIGWTRNPQF